MGVNFNLSYSGSWNRNSKSLRVQYYNRLDEHNNCELSADNLRSGESVSAFCSHDGDIELLNGNVSYQDNHYS